MKKTYALIRVLSALLDDPIGRHWGYDLSKRSGLRSGALYPILHRLLDHGWLVDGWEDQGSARGKRPPRRYYELTAEGHAAASAMLDEARREARFSALLGEPA